MADAITIRALQDASLDAKSLEEVVNGNDAKQVTTRLGETYPSVKKAIKTLFENGGLPAVPFATKALMTASALVDGDYAMVTDDTVNNGLYVKTAGAWVKSAYDPTGLAKTYTDSLATVKSKVIADGTDFNSITTEGTYIVTSNASVTTMTNCPSTKAGVLEVLAVTSWLLAQRYTPYGIEKKIYCRGNDSGTWSDWEELQLKSEADAKFATKTEIANFATNSSVSSSISTSLDAVTQSDFYGKKYSDSELKGASIFTRATIVGYNSIYDKDAIFNAVAARLTNTTVGDVEYRIWFGSKVTVKANGSNWVSSQTALDNPDYIGTCESFPKSDSGSEQNIMLESVVVIPKNTPFVIAFRAVDVTPFSIAHATTVEGNLESRSFNLATSVADFSSLGFLNTSSVETGYVQSGFKLVVATSSDSTPIDDVKYLPELVLPPKIYTMSGLQAHIYPEHLLPEPSDLYLHDVNCSRGKQTVRGWEYDVPASLGASTTTLSWSVHDKQTGNTLSSASTSLIIADSTKAGTKKALVVGDSYVNAGVITQRLLDISSTDPFKVSLIGTLGAGANKHEGRGGWTVSSYTTDKAGNPFWFSGAVNFGQYLTTNSLDVPDFVIVHLGVNDSFNRSSDRAVEDAAATAFERLDTLIASIKAANPNIKIGLVAPNTFGNQDAHGYSYASNYTAWRGKRNMVTWNRELYKRYKDEETQNIYIVATGVNVDTLANFPTTTQATNSHNSTVITVQNNGVHPADSGYKQIGDAMFAWIKAVS